MEVERMKEEQDGKKINTGEKQEEQTHEKSLRWGTD